MSDSQEKSDDLIAELAKLMASDAQGAETGPKPSVIKLPPLNEATVQAAPVRIPGMNAAVPAAETPTPLPAAPTPAAAPASAAPAVRIPGMDRPAGVNEPLPSAPAPRPQFDFGKPPVAAPVIAPEPLVNWQSHEAPKNVGPAPSSPAPMPDTKADSKPANVTRLEPKLASGPVAAASPATSETGKAPAEPAGDGFTFDFGFGGGSGADHEQKQPPTPANDPIADLIAAELDAAETAPEHPAEPAASPGPKIPPVTFNPPPMPAAPPPPATTPQRPVAAQATPVRPVSVAPRPTEGDRFSVAPVFGLASKPAASAPAPRSAAPQADLDPMDEIENLIGEAVRVELEAPAPRPAAPPQAQQQQAPVVPPLNTSFAPRRAQIQDAGPQAAEAAILAAAAASGAEVGRVEAPVSDDRPYKRMKVKPPKTSGISGGARQYVGIAVAGTLLLAAGFGLYWVLGMNRDDPATAPLLTADASPAKVEPVVPAITAQPSGSVVFDEINGVADVDGGETLVSRDETAGASVTEVARAVTPPADDDATETGLANRKVRTVTVRPDGTIVSGDEAVAGTEELPVERPNVPEIPGAEMEPSDLLTAAVAGADAAINDPAAAAAEGADSIAALVSETGEATATELPDPIDVAALPEAESTPPVFDGSLVAPIPMPRPTDRTVLVGSGLGQLPLVDAPAPGANAPASTPLVAVAQPQQQAASQVSSRGGAYVQLSSQPSEDEAQRSLRALQSRMAGTLNGATLEIRQVEIPGRGTWYRVALPVNSFQDATQTCAAIKANGGDCVAING